MNVWLLTGCLDRIEEGRNEEKERKLACVVHASLICMKVSNAKCQLLL